MRPLFLRIVRKGKRNNNPHKNPQGQAENNKGKAPEDRQRRKAEDKRIKTVAKKKKNGQKKGKHATSPKTAKHLTRTKATQATQSTKTTQTHTTTPNRAKNALKTRNRATFRCNVPQAKQKSGQKAGIQSIFANVSKIASKVLHSCTRGHAKRQANRQHFQPFTFPTF